MIEYLSAVSGVLGFICLFTCAATMIAMYVTESGYDLDRKKDRKERMHLILLLLSTGLLLLADVGTVMLEGSFDPVEYHLYRSFILMDHLFSSLSLIFYTEYILQMAEQTSLTRMSRMMVYLICDVLALNAAASIRTGYVFYFDDSHFFQPGPGYRISGMLFLFAMLADWLIIWGQDNKMTTGRRIVLSLYIIFPLFLMLQQAICFVRVQTPNIGLGMAVLFQSSFSGIHRQRLIIEQQEQLIRQQEQLIRQEHELTQMQIRTAVSQMKPHFVFNVLNTIYVLIDQDPEAAKTAVSSFSDFLRGIISAMEPRHLIPFAQELEYIGKYLELERIRYGEEELQVLYDLRVTGFPVPPLSVQPLVENALKHGIGKKPGGGTILIRTEEVDGKLRLTVHDDGVGFDPEALKLAEGDRRPAGIGLENARRRFRLVMNADLQVESSPGQGTTVTVTIPDPETDEKKLPQ